MLPELENDISQAIQQVSPLGSLELPLTPTRKEFTGDYTIVVFPLVKQLKRKPEEIARILGEKLVVQSRFVEKFNVVKGFLNLELTNLFWHEALNYIVESLNVRVSASGKKVVVEYCSPNTNKPIHLGHIRNILLGWSVSNILEAVGHEVHRTQVINDRGIAICKSMLAWKLFGNGKTPTDLGIKGDHYVGDLYVKFNDALKAEYLQWQQSEAAGKRFQAQDKFKDRADFFDAFKNTYFNEYSELGRLSREMLLDWERGDTETVALWERMNSWVYDGFEKTFDALGIYFDSNYYESNTYKLGKEFVLKGLEKGVFYQKDDGSIWADLEAFGMDHKLLLRSDGTSVYMTQDVGTAHQRYVDTGMDSMVYTVGNEQDYHFKALFAILKLLGEPYADDLYHLSYGMVELPTGKMKSREGTVVDADDLIAEVIDKAHQNAAERGEITMLPEEEQEENISRIGMAALKYHMLRVDPRKRMVFNPEESVDLQGQTGPYIQNAYVRIRSIQRKLNAIDSNTKPSDTAGGQYDELKANERLLIRKLLDYKSEVKMAAEQYDPSIITNYLYALAKEFHKFYHDVPIIQSDESEARMFRAKLIETVAQTLEKAMALLGIQMPNRM